VAGRGNRGGRGGIFPLYGKKRISMEEDLKGRKGEVSGGGRKRNQKRRSESTAGKARHANKGGWLGQEEYKKLHHQVGRVMGGGGSGGGDNFELGGRI